MRSARGAPQALTGRYHLPYSYHSKTMAISVQKVGPKGQVTLPKQVRLALGLKTGALVETVLTRDGALTRPVELRPKIVDLEAALAEAEADVKAGRVSKPYRSARALVRDAIRAGKRHGRHART